jgi:hypothetical protein
MSVNRKVTVPMGSSSTVLTGVVSHRRAALTIHALAATPTLRSCV